MDASNAASFLAILGIIFVALGAAVLWGLPAAGIAAGCCFVFISGMFLAGGS